MFFFALPSPTPHITHALVNHIFMFCLSLSLSLSSFACVVCECDRPSSLVNFDSYCVSVSHAAENRVCLFILAEYLLAFWNHSLALFLRHLFPILHVWDALCVLPPVLLVAHTHRLVDSIPVCLFHEIEIERSPVNQA